MDKTQPCQNPLRGSALELAILDRGNQSMRSAGLARERGETFDHPLHQANIQADQSVVWTDEDADKSVGPTVVVHANRDGTDANDKIVLHMLKNARDFPRALPGFIRIRQRSFLQPESYQLLSHGFRYAAEYPAGMEALGCVGGRGACLDHGKSVPEGIFDLRFALNGTRTLLLHVARSNTFYILSAHVQHNLSVSWCERLCAPRGAEIRPSVRVPGWILAPGSRRLEWRVAGIRRAVIHH